MMPRTSVTATDLVTWASSRESQSLLPVLVRRLVFGTGQELQRVGFPAHESVQLGGWDGIVVAGEGDTFVPAGASAWEVSVEDDVGAKANADYNKRTADPKGVKPLDCTYVFVTPRRWKGKDDWIKARKAEEIWRDVRAYDADDLELWLERSPSTLSWLAERLGLRFDEIWELGSHWRDWAASTSPPLTPELVLAGRADAEKAVAEWLASGRPSLTLVAESREEALAVFEAAVERLQPDDRDRVQCHTLVVGADSAWQRLARFDRQLILVPNASGLEPGAALRRGHRLVVPSDRASVPDGPDVVEVERVSRREARAALVGMGLPESQADELAALARRNVLALRRRLSAAPGSLKPTWLRTPDASALIPLLMLGSWDQDHDGDRAAVEVLGGIAYKQLEALLLRLGTAGDPPARKVGSTWRAVSREELWGALGPLLTDHHVEEFIRIGVAALTQVDAAQLGGFEEQIAASLRGEKPQYSPLLRKAIADALAFLGTRGEGTHISSARSVADGAVIVVRRVLEQAGKDLAIWASIAPMMAALAEAAPDALLSAIDDDLRNPSPVLAGLFGEKDDHLFSSTPHTGLLWGLELLAWSPRFLPGSALQLARLACLDPGGRLSNRPANSLTDIFRLWRPATAASVEERLGALDLLRREEPPAAWALMVSLLPTGHDVAMSKATPQWRDWATDRLRDMTWGEYHKMLEAIVSRLLVDVGPPGPRWSPLVESLGHLPPALVERVLGQLEASSVDSASDSDRGPVLESLRELVSRHRSVPDKDHRLPDEFLGRLEKQMERLQPRSPANQHAWLFAWWPSMPEGHEEDIHAQQRTVAVAQERAVRAIVTEDGLSGLLQTAALAERPDLVGDISGRLGEVDEETRWLGAYLIDERAAIQSFARGYVGGRFATAGWEWIDNVLEYAKENWQRSAVAALLASIPPGARVWDVVERQGLDVERAYWRQTHPFGLQSSEEIDRAARKLLQHERPFRALDLMGLNLRGKEYQPDPELVARGLEAAAQCDPAKDRPTGGSFDYSVEALLDWLAESGGLPDGRLASLEWMWMPVFRFGRRAPTVLHRELARNPGFFVELVTLIYRGKSDAPRELDEHEQRRASIAYDLLQHWRSIPGLEQKPGSAGLSLEDWVRDTRRLLAERNRTEVGDISLGHLLSGSPQGMDGFWPHEAIRDVIEQLGSEDLEQGISTGVYNSRGVVSRGSGGGQERALAEHYERQAAGVEARWPRTTAMLRNMASGYQHEAHHEDLDAEFREDA